MCPKCGNHSLKERLIENQSKCINCGGDHFACVKNKQNLTQNYIPAAKPFAQVTKGEQAVPEMILNKIETNLQKKLEEILTISISALIEKLLPALLESLLSKATVNSNKKTVIRNYKILQLQVTFQRSDIEIRI